MSAPTVISLFAGCGGSSLGYQLAGYRELLAVEWDDNAVATFRLNFPDVPVYHGDIAALSVDECLRLAGVAPGELDLLDGSPPCQGFSTAGKRLLDDPRNQLFREYVRMLRGLRPRAFVMENVSGLVKGKMKLVFAEILRELKASGYVVSARLMNAMYFNVPQSRERLIFVGVREDLGIAPSHPLPLVRPITVGAALINCVDTDGPPLTSRVLAATRYMVPGNYSGDIMGRAMQRVGKSGGFNNKILSWDRYACTLPRMVMNETGVIHPEKARYISIGEAMRLTSFPDEFQFIGEYQERWAGIGNSVPPNFMAAIAAHIRDHILTPTREVA